MAKKKDDDKPLKKYNTQNLKPCRTKSEARERGKKGGKASGRARHEKKELKKALEVLLADDVEDKKGNVHSGCEAICISLFKKALSGDVRAFEMIRDTVGQKPADKIEYAEISQETIDEIQKAILEDDEET